jgi:uncharacterized protein
MRESRYNIWVERADAAYVFNSATGALLRVAKEDRRALERMLAGEESDCSPKVLAHLVAGRMVVPDDADELTALADRYRDTQGDTSLFALTILTSLACNFDCPYCFEAKDRSIMDEDVQEMVLHVLDEQLPRIEGFRVTWFGGEPLAGKKSLLALSDAFLERCDRFGVAYEAEIVTNGYLLDEGTCQQLRQRRVATAQIGLDGPPDVHDRMRPLLSGKGTFDRIVSNLHHAVDYFATAVRVNIDAGNFARVEELFRILVAEGFVGRLGVYPGHLVGLTSNPLAPSATYGGCFSNREFAEAERRFLALAREYGLSSPALPTPTGAPCTAVRANELVVGSRGELYKCWDTAGDHREVIGHIRDHNKLNSRLAKWLAYDPFANDECRGCIALPVCMGGCAHHAFDKLQYENRCGTFRHTYREQVREFIDFAEERGFNGLTPVARLARAMETR